MSTSIFYFSGSGNSLFIAKELQNRMVNSKLIPIASLLNNESIVAESETIGFVFPVHCTTMPVPVKEFIKKLGLKHSNYIFAIATQGGAPPRLVELHIEKMLKEKGKALNAFFSIKMAWSSPIGLMPIYIPGFIEYPKPKEKVIKFDSVAQKKLDLIQKILEQKACTPKDDFPRSINLPLKRLVCKLMSPATNELEKNQIDFCSDSDCTGCGTCKNVCLSQKIKMIDGKPVWQKDVQCYFCYACFSFCPAQSVIVNKIYTQKGERYFPPGITANDNAMQKN